MDKKNVLIKISAFLNSTKFKIIFFILSVFFVCGLIGLSSYIVYMRVGIDTIKDIVRTNVEIIPNYLSSVFTRVDTIKIDISEKNYQKLLAKRAEAISYKYLLSSSDDFVPATITFEGKTIDVKLRLKGDNLDHLQHPYKWSFRVEMEGENTVYGMKNFSLQLPKTRDYMNEWLFHKFLSFNDLIGLRYKFANLRINGKRAGIYAVEEHFEKRLIENNQYKEGPIIRFKNDSFWTILINRDIGYSTSIVDAFNSNLYYDMSPESIVGTEQLERAKFLLESFRLGKLATYEVFDVKKLAKLFAVSDLMGQDHILSTENIRFYYNPLTGLIDPIGYDNQLIHVAVKLVGSGKKLKIGVENNFDERLDWLDQVFRDPIFYKEYTSSLEEFANNDILHDFFTSIEGEEKQNLKILHKSYPYYDFKSKDILLKNSEFIKNIFTAGDNIRVYYNGVDKLKNLKLEVGNVDNFPIEIISVSYGNRNFDLNNKSLLLQPHDVLNLVDYRDLIINNFNNITDFDVKNIKVKYRIFGAKDTKEMGVIQRDFPERELIYDSNIRGSNIQNFSFLDIDKNAKEISVKSGQWKISSDLIIPSGYRFFIYDGTKIDFTNNAGIYSYSPVNLLGTKERPVEFYSSDSTGSGFFVLQANEESILENVKFFNLATPNKVGLSISGSIMFYESPVIMKNVVADTNRVGDDYFNIVRSKFKIENLEIKNTLADAIDFDFSAGTIVNSRFTNIGTNDRNGDAIDFSGSEVDLENIYLELVSNKALSVGEASNVDAKNINIVNSNLGIASKDNSKININEISFNNLEYGFVAYQKKSEFGSASIEVNGFTQTNVKQLYKIEIGSALYLDGQKIIGDKTGLAEKF